MATFNVTTSNKYISGYVEYNETFNEDYISTNKSTLTATLYLHRTNNYSGTPTSSSNCTLTFVIDGTTYPMNIGTKTIPNDKSYVNIGSASKEITHNNDGSYSTSISVSYNMPYSNLSISNQNSGTIYLTTIPRASSIACSSPYIGDNAIISIDKKSSSFTHTLTYKIGTLTGTIATKTSSTTLQLNTSEISDQIYTLIPNDKEIQGTIYCTTYSGDTQIGDTKSTTFNLYAKESACKPDVSATIVDTNTSVTNITDKFIKYISKPKVTINATAKNSATIANYSINLNDGQNSNLQENTFDTIGSNKITVNVTDSRGYKAYENGLDYELDMIDYIKLHVNKFLTTRPEGTSNEVIINLAGVWYNGNFSTTKPNTLSASYQYKNANDAEWTTGGSLTLSIAGNTFKIENLSLGTIFDYNEEYVFKFSISDLLMTITETMQVPKGQEVWWESEDGIGVNGNIWLNDLMVLGFVQDGTYTE